MTYQHSGSRSGRGTSANLARQRPSFVLRPVVLALLSAFPGAGLWAASSALPANIANLVKGYTPGVNEVPVPAKNSTGVVGGVVQTQAAGAASPAVVNFTNINQQNLQINQSAQRAIYNWSTFNIGANASVTYNMAIQGGQALNRVTGSALPSQIFGSLTATNGGEIFLINPNGILFGQGAQVNVGGLFASTLDILNSDFLAGMSSISQAAPTFSYQFAGGVQNTAALYNSAGFVAVDTQANITTPSGGRVFLMAPTVYNAGSISTPQGQTVLAAGANVYLTSPIQGGIVLPVYATEDNPNVPTLRGLLVEVDDGPNAAAPTGSVTNASSGQITTNEGNTTLVAYAVNQNGRISASTSVSENGSVFLQARTGTETNSSQGIVLKEATYGGSLTLGSSSVITMNPDDQVGSNGQAQTSADSSPFYPSTLYLSGHSIALDSGSNITAPGADVIARAEGLPNYAEGPEQNAQNGILAYNELYSIVSTPGTQLDTTPTAWNNSASFAMAVGATIDVAGTTDTVVNGARNFITTGVLGKVDLADSPAEKNNPVVYYQPVTYDLRTTPSILSSSSASGYAQTIERTASERMASGGTIDIVSSGVVATSPGASLNISGGQVAYTAVNNLPITQLEDSAGNWYNFSNAPQNDTYIASRKIAYSEAGYVQGEAAGSLYVMGQQVLLGGSVQTQTLAGRRQIAGLDPLAQSATLSVVSDTTDLSIQSLGLALSSADWASLLAGVVPSDLPTTSLLPTGWLQASSVSFSNTNSTAVQATQSSFGNIQLISDTGISLSAQNDLKLAPGTQLSMVSNGAQGIELDSSIDAPDGNISLLAQQALSAIDVYNLATGVSVNPGPTQGLLLGSGLSLDVAGVVLNQAGNGPNGGLVLPVGSQGGQLSLASYGNISLGADTILDVSGGATIAQALSGGKLQTTVTGGDAGSISIKQVFATDTLALGTSASPTQFLGYSLVKGGALSLSTDQIYIDDASGAQAAQAAGSGEVLSLSAGFFSQGGFVSYSLDGLSSLTLGAPSAGNAITDVIAPRNQVWQLANVNVINTPSGTPLAELSTPQTLAYGLRQSVNLSLQSTGNSTGKGGVLTVNAGVQIDSDPQAKISFQSAGLLDFDGQVIDHGGDVSLVGSIPTNSSVQTGYLWLGGSSAIDVSGVDVATPNANNLNLGNVLAGGDVSLQADSNTFIVLQDGSRINVSGAQGTYLMSTATAGGTNQLLSTTLASNAGAITISAPDGAVLEGGMQAQAGGPQAAGGQLSLNVAGAPYTSSILLQALPGSSSLDASLSELQALQESNAHQASVATSTLNQAGFADIALNAQDVIAINTPETALSLSAVRSLSLSTSAYSLAAGDTLNLIAPSINFGNTNKSYYTAGGQSMPGEYLAEASGGTATINVQGSGQVSINGLTALQGVGQLNIVSQGDVLLNANGVTPGTGLDMRPVGELSTAGNVSITAAQVYPVTDTVYQINSSASDGTVSISKADAALPALPLSAGSTLDITAAHIVQGGVLRAPLGYIDLSADSIQLLAGSDTSVSGAGLLVPFGSTVNGSSWTYNGLTYGTVSTNDLRSMLLQKGIALNAPSGAVQVQAQAVVDVSGGGDVQASEFVAGPGGSVNVFAGAANGAFAIVPSIEANASGYAAVDRAILTQKDASGNTANIPVGEQITFGAGGPVPAGTYTVLPAAYALLPGGYLISADTSHPGLASLNAPALQLPSGAYSVAGYFSFSGTSIQDPAERFVVETQSVALQSSQINLTSGNAYFAALDTHNQVPVQALPLNAGNISIDTLQLSLAPDTLLFGSSVASSSAGSSGVLDIAAGNIAVGGTSSAPDTLNLSVAALNSSGAATLILGASLSDAAAGVLDNPQSGVPATSVQGATPLTTVASTLTVQTGSTPLTAQDILLAASTSVSVSDGASIVALAGSQSGANYAFTGDGASLRVSNDPSATVTRSNTDGQQGDLSIGAAQLNSHQGSISAEASRTTTLSNGLSLSAQSMSLGGDVALGAVVDNAQELALTPELLAQVNSAQNLTLRSYNSLNVYGDASNNTLTLGAATLAQLNLDTPGIQAIAPTGGSLTVNALAGQLTLSNSGASTLTASSGTSILNLSANGLNGQTGDVILGPGQVASLGFGTVHINAARSVVLAGTGGLSTGGDLTLQSASVVAQAGANTSVQVGGNLTLQSNGASASAAAGLGGTLSLAAQGRIVQGGDIDLPTGVVNLSSAASGAAPAIEFSAGSQTSVAGQSVDVGGTMVPTFGGNLLALASLGSISVDAGAVLNVSGPATGQSGGQLTLSAAQGQVQLAGSLLGTAAADQTGASLSITAGASTATYTSLTNLATVINAGGSHNFAQNIAYSSGSDLSLASTDQLKAANISLTSGGQFDVAGQLNADGVSGGNITLAAVGNLNINSGAQLSAQSTQASSTTAPNQGGWISLTSSTGSINIASAGTAPQFNLSSLGGTTAGGVLALNAPRINNGTGVAINAALSASNILGASAIQVQAVKQYTGVKSIAATGSGTTLGMNTVSADNASFASNISAIQASLSSDPLIISELDVRPGVEVDASGNLQLSTAWNLGDSGVPMDLTLRAAGNLSITGSISAGFNGTANTSLAQVGPASNITLVGGADLASANVLATSPAALAAGTGNVTLGQTGSTASTIVRSTTGNIAIAAANNISLANNTVAVYTTGQPVMPYSSYIAIPSKALHPVYASSSAAAQSTFKAFLPGSTTPFYENGGTVSLVAGSSVLGTAAVGDDTITPANWWYLSNFTATASGTAAGQVTWWSRYDQFAQGLATFGGGDVRVLAGQSVKDLQLAAVGSGYVSASGTRYDYGGGSVSVEAGANIDSTNALATGAGVSYSAGGNVGASSDALSGSTASTGPFIGVFNGASNVNAVGTIALTQIGDAATLAQVLTNNTTMINSSVGMLSTSAAASVEAAGLDQSGGASVADALTLVGPTGGENLTAISGIYQSELHVVDKIAAMYSLVALNGSIAAGTVQTLTQLLPTDAQLVSNNKGSMATGVEMVAANSLNLATLYQTGGLPGGADDSAQSNPLGLDDTSAVDPASSKTPANVILVGASGDVNLGTVSVASATQVQAGRDVVIGAGLTIQQQAADELSSITAGRDVAFSLTDQGTTQGNGLFIAGPGNLLVVAGRDVNLGASAGIVATGNSNNSALPDASAQISVMAGVDLASGDFTQAANQLFQVLGGHELSAAEVSAAGGNTTALYNLALDDAQALGLSYADSLVSFIQTQVPGAIDSSASTRSQQLAALQAFAALSPQAQAVFLQQVLAAELRTDGRAANAAGVTKAQQSAAYALGYAAINDVFPGSSSKQRAVGNISMASSQIQTLQGSNINMWTPGGGVNAGLTSASGLSKSANYLGITTVQGGDITAMVDDDFTVNSSRVGTIGLGNVLIWSSLGNIDAGRGAKTVVDTPPPTYSLNSSGQLVVDIANSFVGSGIQVLNANSDLDLYAPRGAIDAGDAGIVAKGTAFFGAQQIIGASNISAANAVGLPAAAPSVVVPVAAPMDPGAQSGQQGASNGLAPSADTKRQIDLDYLGPDSVDTDVEKSASDCKPGRANGAHCKS